MPSSELHFGALREMAACERQGALSCRGKPINSGAPQHAQAYRDTLYRVSKSQIRRGRRATPSSKSQRSAELLYARIKCANGRLSEREAVSDHGLFSSYDSQPEAADGQDSRCVF